MPRNYQIIPEHRYPHQMVVINDNTTISDIPSSDSGDAKLLCVFASPKGIDGKMRTVRGSAQFLKDYGIGSYEMYGQPLLNAYNAALSGAATLQCMRVTAANAVYSTIHIVAQYKFVAVSPAQVETATVVGTIGTSGNATVTVTSATMQNSPKAISVAVLENDDASAVADKIRTALGLDADVSAIFTVGGAAAAIILTKKTVAVNDATLNIAIANGTCAGLTAAPTSVNTTPGSTDMSVRFLAKAGTPITDLANLEASYSKLGAPTEDGYTEVKIFSVGYLGKGTWGNNIRVRISSYGTGDRENSYKNYNFEVYENDGGLLLKETFPIVFGSEDAIVDDVVLFSDSVINDPSSGSSYIVLKTFVDGIEELVEAYTDEFSETGLTVENFDFFLGVNRLTNAAIADYVVDTTSEVTGLVSISDLSGIALASGSDGDFSLQTASQTRAAAFVTAYTNAFNGTTDPAIKSKNHFPVNLILDANYTNAVKILLATLAIARTDCAVILDCGTGITTKSSVATYVSTNLNSYVLNRVQMIDAYAGKIRDPYSKKVVTVTGTYLLSASYPIHFQVNGGKHVPLAGNNFGVLSGFIPNTIYPVFDEDVDSVLMDALCDARINFARINANQDTIRATQTTRQEASSNLSEANNVMVLLDVKRDCEKLCASYEYNFSEASDIARFNRDASIILDRYAASQVRSIKASFNKSDWEAERGILHLYVEFVNKDLVKTTIIEIDVNR
jgi:hypothetical protein